MLRLQWSTRGILYENYFCVFYWNKLKKTIIWRTCVMSVDQELDIPWTFYKSCKSNDIGAIRSVRFNSDGTYCVTGGSDKVVRLWNPVKALLLKSYMGHGQEVLDVASSHDNSQLASGSKDHMVMIWDVMTGHSIRRFREHYGAVNCVVFNPEESSVLVSGSVDSKCHIWDMRSRVNKPMQSLEDSKDTIMSIYISDHEIITTSVDCNLRTYDIRMGILTVDFMGKPICSSKLSRDKLSILCSCLDNSIRLVDKETGAVLNTYKGHQNCDYKIESSFIKNDSYIVSGSEDGKIVFWDLITARVIKETPAHNGSVVSLSYCSTNNRLLTAGPDGISLWVGDQEP
ncbi:hypothetical protein HZS_5499 [Henneguya salminicola]|nr:hypothetical protein HZS_5499 [Henneguya salminicola]